MKNRIERILWLDCIGGLVVGFAVISLYRLISHFENLPISIVVTMGVANLLYGSYSLFVTTRRRRSKKLIEILAIANVIWLFVCVSILVCYWQQISIFGITHVLGEGVYVAVLGFIEWQLRERLSWTSLANAG